MPGVDYCLLKKALTGWEDECGDTGFIKEYANECFIALIDALGHGREAFAIAQAAEDFLQQHYTEALVDVMNGLHTRLKETRGAVAAFCRIDIPSGKMQFAGVGNISVRIFADRHHRMLSRDGILGYMITAPKEQEMVLHPGDILMLSSDGIKEHFDPDEYPRLLSGSANEIAENMMTGFGKGNDDTSCIVLRYQR